MERQIYLGRPFPLGATWDGEGVNFAIFSKNATAVYLCLFRQESDIEYEEIKFRERNGNIWHMYLPGIKPGQLYAFKVDGPFDPDNGLRFNKNKLLIDPNAKAFAGSLKWNDALFGYIPGHPDEDKSFNESDSAPYMPKAVVSDAHFDWEGDTPPNIPYHKTIIYEAHVKGLTYKHPQLPENVRGTYSALGHPVMIEYFKKLGITAVELMPVHYFLTDRHLQEKGLTNYWGYNTINFFAPDKRYARDKEPGSEVNEFKQMVKELHKAGIEVILDVVYNHTGEGNQMGPTISYRGIDNDVYYKLAEDKRYYMDYTGTGNTLHAGMPEVLRLIMDSLRYWITDMHVDGFRFDLAAALARELHEINMLSAFFNIIYQDPVISQVKLIAEPWDVGDGGYQVGNFPGGWCEWNGKYRDCMRDYWRGADSMLEEFGSRFTGSSDLYQDDNRRPTASVNFITAHDGFTLHDLVSYNDKHNEANGEDNNDGEDHNRSWNCGEEGPTDNEEIIALRNRQKRNMLATLFLSQGVPMMVAGDELGRTQQGNNNTYCQDNELSWVDWKNADEQLLDFTRKLIHIRKKHPIFRRRRWFQGQPIHGSKTEDIAWFIPDGQEMTEDNWKHDFAKSLGIFLNGKAIHMPGIKGEPIMDDSFYVIFNAHHEKLGYVLPAEKYGNNWVKILDTSIESFTEDNSIYQPGQKVEIEGRSVVVFKRNRDTEK